MPARGAVTLPIRLRPSGRASLPRQAAQRWPVLAANNLGQFSTGFVSRLLRLPADPRACDVVIAIGGPFMTFIGLSRCLAGVVPGCLAK